MAGYPLVGKSSWLSITCCPLMHRPACNIRYTTIQVQLYLLTTLYKSGFKYLIIIKNIKSAHSMQWKILSTCAKLGFPQSRPTSLLCKGSCGKDGSELTADSGWFNFIDQGICLQVYRTTAMFAIGSRQWLINRCCFTSWDFHHS